MVKIKCIKTEPSTIFRIKPTSPYNFDLTVGIFSKFLGEVVDIFYINSAYRRLLNIAGNYVFVSVKSVGNVDNPELYVEVYPEDIQPDENLIKQKLEHILSTNIALEGFYSMMCEDKVLSEITNRLYALRPPRTESFYEALVIAIIEQQIALPIAVMNKGYLVRKYGKKILFDGKEYYAFPAPYALANTKVEDLRKLRLSRRKAEYIIELSTKIINGELDLAKINSLQNQEIIDILTKIRGIGKWTAEYAIVRGLGRLDSLPANDVALRKVVSTLYYGGKEVSEDDVRKLLDKWGKYKGFAAFYLLNMGRLK